LTGERWKCVFDGVHRGIKRRAEIAVLWSFQDAIKPRCFWQVQRAAAAEIDGLAMLVQGVLDQDPFLCVGRGYVARHISVHGVSVRVPRAHPGQPDQDHLLRWHRLLSLHQLPQWYARSGPAALNVELL